jgi:hypothetical protein
MAAITLDLMDRALKEIPYLIYPVPGDPDIYQYMERKDYRWRTWTSQGGSKRWAALDCKYGSRWLYVFHLKMN